MEHFPSRAAIGGIIAGVSVYEALCPPGEFISDEVDRLRDTKIGRFVVPLVIGATAGHLLGVIPPKWDIIHQMTRLKREAVQ